MFRTVRRLTFTVAAAAAAVSLFATQADAHECFNVNRSTQANNQIAAHSHGWFDIQTWQLLSIFDGQCDPTQGGCLPTIPGTEALADVGFDTLIGVILGFAPPAALGSPEAIAAFNVLKDFNMEVADAASQAGVPTHYLTLNNASAAGGAPGKVTTNGKGIDHFPDVYGGQLMDAFMTTFCGDFPDSCT
jgi:hypothetical protein